MEDAKEGALAIVELSKSRYLAEGFCTVESLLEQREIASQYLPLMADG